jgi:hypothetical protein
MPKLYRIHPNRRWGMLASISVGTSKNGGAAGGEAKAPVEAGIPQPYPKKWAARIRGAKCRRCSKVAIKIHDAREFSFPNV